MEQDKQTAEQRVKAKWPDAYIYKWGGWRDGESGFSVRRKDAIHKADQSFLGSGETESEAWADAASRLEEG